MNCSVVVPVFRGEATLEALAQRLGKVLPLVADQFEVILVNDGSPDGSWDIISELARQHAWIRGISLSRNYGQENATLCGILDARFEVIATMDDDLQHSPEDLPILLQKLDEGYDVVYGVPRVRRQSWWKSAAATMVKRVISWSMGMKAVRDLSAFKVFRADLKDTFGSLAGRDVLIDVLLSWITSRFASVEIEEAPRAHGESNYDLAKLVKVAMRAMTNYTTIPLRLASIMGFVFTMVGAFVLLYVLTIYFTLGSIPGFTFLASVLAIFSGVQLFALGIIGEYLARLFDRSSGRPPYAIRARVGGAR
ncbi:MAG TPA: glycosyltransferase family 2 protein [Anaerolineales bacterium]|nr:glycosyltransferase family 2 protein [Anaerolineales bacterium]